MTQTKNSYWPDGPFQWFQSLNDKQYYLSEKVEGGDWSDDTFIIHTTDGNKFWNHRCSKITDVEQIKHLNEKLSGQMFVMVVTSLRHFSVPFSWDLFSIKYQVDGMHFRAEISAVNDVPILKVYYANVCTFSTHDSYEFGTYFIELYKNLSR